MAIRLIEGFEQTAATGSLTAQYFERKYASLFSGPGSAPGYLGGLSLQSSSFAFTTKTFTAQDTWIIHWWWFLNQAGTTSNTAGFYIRDSGGVQLALVIRSATGVSDNDDRYYIDLNRGVTTLASAGPFWAESWLSGQLKVTIDPTDGAYELKVAQTNSVGKTPVTVMSDAGPVNTADQGTSGADRFLFDSNNGPRTMQLDHLVICDDTGSANNDFLGEVYVGSLLPSADGDDLDWTPSTGATHYTLVNEVMPGTPTTQDLLRVTSDTVSDFDRWFMQGLGAVLTIPTGTSVFGLSVETTAAMEASGSRDLRAVFKDGTAATAEGTSFTVTDTPWLTFVQIWETNPATAAAWSVSTVDAGQFGVKVQA